MKKNSLQRPLKLTMPVPTSYTEAAFAVYLHSVLSTTAVELGWSADGTTPGDYTEVINDTLFACGVAAIDEMMGMADVQKLRTLGRYYAWQAAVEALVVEHNLSADGATLQRETVFKQAQQMLSQAADKASTYGIGPYGNYSVEIIGVAHNDPYQPVDLT